MNNWLEAWQIPSWPRCQWRLPDDSRDIPVFSHLTTKLRDGLAPADDGLFEGDTVWSAQIGDDKLGLAWAWIELRPGVVMARDPNIIVTNICFVNSSLQPESELDAIISVNRLLHFISWQDVVAGLVMDSRLKQHSERGG